MAALPDETPEQSNPPVTTAMDGRVPEALLGPLAQEFSSYDADGSDSTEDEEEDEGGEAGAPGEEGIPAGN
ncbi:hypothetical protein ACQB60_18665 [Actinomycetota bacterium Odt1-20B]